MSGMAVAFVPNFEEAAGVATDFMSSIDNLPKEVDYLLEEIKIKEEKCQDLLQEIARNQARYVKSALKSVSNSSPNAFGFNRQNRSVSPTPTPTNSSSKAHLPGRIASAYAEVATLNEEKIALAHTLINLLTLTKARLDVDIVKVRTLQGEPVEDIRVPPFDTSGHLPSSSGSLLEKQRSETAISGINPVAQINESLRNATISMHADTSGPAYNKKRRLTTNTSVKLSSPAPAPTTQTTSRSRPSRQVQIVEQDEEEINADAEGEEDLDAEDAEEDTTLYCFCKKQSYGDMIGCDNPACQYQWFHISCVGVKHPFPDKWYCPECSKKSLATEKLRKGRKK